MNYEEMLEKELDKRKGFTLKNIKGKPFLYLNGKYVGPASEEQIQVFKDKSNYYLLKWTLKNLNQVLASAKLISDLSKNYKK